MIVNHKPILNHSLLYICTLREPYFILAAELILVIVHLHSPDCASGVNFVFLLKVFAAVLFLWAFLVLWDFLFLIGETEGRGVASIIIYSPGALQLLGQGLIETRGQGLNLHLHVSVRIPPAQSITGAYRVHVFCSRLLTQ